MSSGNFIPFSKKENFIFENFYCIPLKVWYNNHRTVLIVSEKHPCSIYTTDMKILFTEVSLCAAKKTIEA